MRVTCRHLGQIDFESVPGFVPAPRLYTTRKYPCGCAAAGLGDVPNYCPDHGAAQPDIKADFDKAHALLVNFGFAFLALVAGWILAKIF